MAVSFSVTNPVSDIELKEGYGELVYTVTNTTRRSVRARSYIDIDLKDVDEAWFSVDGEEVRTFSPNETAIFKVLIQVPPDQESKTPKVSLGVCNIEKPQEDYKPGPVVEVTGLQWSEEKPLKPWYKRQPWITLWILLIVAAIAVPIIIVLNKPNYEGMGLVEALAAIDEDQLELGDVNWDFDDTVEDKKIKYSGTVLKSEIEDGEVSIWIQYWHPYDPNTANKKLGKTKSIREKNLDTLNDRVEKLEEKNVTFPLKVWLNIEMKNRKIKRLAKRKDISVKELGSRKVVYLSAADEDDDDDDEDDDE